MDEAVKELTSKAQETLEFVLHRFASVRVPTAAVGCDLAKVSAVLDLPAAAAAAAEVVCFTVFPTNLKSRAGRRGR